MAHGITAEEYARVLAQCSEPDLNWDNPAQFDLLDREVLLESAQKQLDRLAWAGFSVERLDDLALNEFV